MCRAILRRNIGYFSKALRDFNKALELDPNNFDILMKRSALLMDGGRPDLALNDLDALLKTQPRSVKAHGNRAYILARMGRHDEAIRELKSVLTLDPGNVMAMKHLGHTYAQRGQAKEAVKWYQAALKTEKGRGAQRTHQVGSDSPQAVKKKITTQNPQFSPRNSPCIAPEVLHEDSTGRDDIPAPHSSGPIGKASPISLRAG